MTTFNMNKGTGYSSLLFPDNQPHITIEDKPDKPESRFNPYAEVICSITSSQKLLELQMLTDAIDRGWYIKMNLHIPYLMGARYDRVMNPGDSFDLKVISKIINSLDFNRVYLYDPHSDIAPALIENSIVIDNRKIVERYNKPDSVLIIPDAGAAKKAHKYGEWNSNLKYTVHCIKERDLKTGEIKLEVVNPEMCLEADCVIIDDICDGGRTFIEIAKAIKKVETEELGVNSLTLIVTHGIFSKGFAELTNYFDQIITTDSYNKIHNHHKITQIPCLTMTHT